MSQVVVTREGAVAVVRLNRPDAMNALGLEMRAELEATVPALLADPAVRCLLLTGTGAAFCAGGDVLSMREPSPEHVRQRTRRLHAWVRPLIQATKPVVTAVNGHVVGAGLSLALVGDVVLTVPGARFRAGFPAIGAVADLGCAVLLPRLVGLSRAREILLTNRVVTAEEALAIGMVHHVVPDGQLLERAMTVAAELAAGPTLSLGLTKALLHRAFEATLDQALELEAFSQATAFFSDDFREGVEAFVAKRAPRFEGR